MEGQSACPVLFVNGTPVEESCSGVFSIVDADQLVGQPRREERLDRVRVIAQRAHGNAKGGRGREQEVINAKLMQNQWANRHSNRYRRCKKLYMIISYRSI